jgi:pyruvate kinase
MLESMMENPRPTRAEASDVANAVLDGADAVMLSGETAVGKYPVEAVRAMNSISQVVQNDVKYADDFGVMKGMPVTDVIGSLVTDAVDAVDTAAILVVTRSGVSARMVSKHRPQSRILAVARDSRVRRRMIMYWGVEPLNVPWTEDRDNLILRSVKWCIQKGFLKQDDLISVVSGSTLIAPGRTTSLEILEVDDILRFASRRD